MGHTFYACHIMMLKISTNRETRNSVCFSKFELIRNGSDYVGYLAFFGEVNSRLAPSRFTQNLVIISNKTWILLQYGLNSCHKSSSNVIWMILSIINFAVRNFNFLATWLKKILTLGWRARSDLPTRQKWFK